MSFAKVYSAQATLLHGQIVSVEIDLSRGLHAFTIVGLPDKAVEESRDRVSAAIKNSGFTSPKSKNQKVVISLAPADLKKEGPVFDVAMALAYLLAAEDISFDPEGKLFIGELSLDGDVRPVRGILPLVSHAKQCGFKEVYVPKDNAMEGALIDGILVYGATTLQELIEHLNTKTKEGKEDEKRKLTPQKKTRIKHVKEDHRVDIGDIRGQEAAKRGLLIAASGGHNIALYGPPGTGKTMLARAFASILPPLLFDEALVVTSIHSVAGALQETLITTPPFRSPHHTSSYVSIVGGGTIPRPGEVTLAHQGVLFLDEFPEFDRRVIESLREPLEERSITVARARATVKFPAGFILVAAMNPCPCGNFGSRKTCICSPISFERYKKKLSGPIIDRIDMWIEVPHINHDKLANTKGTKESSLLSEKVKQARAIQRKRFKKITTNTNSGMGVRDIDAYIILTSSVKKLLSEAAKKLDLSPRSYHRVIKLARTIADLEGKDHIEETHMLEALQYRPRTKIFG